MNDAALAPNEIPVAERSTTESTSNCAINASTSPKAMEQISHFLLAGKRHRRDIRKPP
jgi:hypothetical protein